MITWLVRRCMRGLTGARLAHHAGGVLMNRRIHVRTLVRPVTVAILGRLGHMVATVGIMMVTVAPGGRFPARHVATGVQQVDGEDGSTRYGITVYGTPIRVTVDGEAIGIITGGSPGHRGAVAIRGNGNRVVTIGVHLAGGGEEHHPGGKSQHAGFQVFVFHGNK